MTELVPLLRAESEAAEGYDVRLGPLRFVAPIERVSEMVGDGLDAVGAALVAAERKPRGAKIALKVRAPDRPTEGDPRDIGLRLRRQVRQAMNNARLRLGGFFFLWDVDDQMDCWLAVGGGELGEADPGISFGEYELSLSEVFIRGRPGTHRPGRYARIADMRTGLVPRDTRGLLLSTDFAAQALFDHPLALPGDIASVTRSSATAVSSTIGPEREGSRHLWQLTAAVDGEALSYSPDPTLLPERDRYLTLDELGSVRIWDLSAATVYPPAPAAYTALRDERPDLFYGWEQVLGSTLTAQHPLAIENGACRLIWLGATAGLAIEYWDNALGHFRRLGSILHATGTSEQWVVEATPERGVIEWRAGAKAMRAILQRGWTGPRIESYEDNGGTARLEFDPEGEGLVVGALAPTWVKGISALAGGSPELLWATTTTTDKEVAPALLGEAAFAMTRTQVLVAQLACPGGLDAEQLAGASLADVRAKPVLVAR